MGSPSALQHHKGAFKNRRQQDSALRHTGNDMGNTNSIRPSVGAVIFKGSEVLLIKRGRPPLKNHWSIPGGKLEFGEKVEEALVREVREETGVEINVIGLIDVFESLPQREGDSHYLMIDYVAEWVSGEPVPGDDAEEAEFLSFPEALSRLAWDQTRTALQQAKLALKKAKEAASD